MKTSRFSDEQIAHTLRQAKAGTPVAEIVRKLGVSEATFYAWKKKVGTMGTAEIRKLRQLREENSKLKRLVADLSLDGITRVRRPERVAPSSRATVRRTRVAYRVGWAIYAAATLLALASPIASLALYLIVTAYFLIPHGADSDFARV